MFKIENMINWVFIWAFIAFPFMLWEGTPTQYNLVQQYGRDPVTLVVVAIVLIPFIGCMVRRA